MQLTFTYRFQHCLDVTLDGYLSSRTALEYWYKGKKYSASEVGGFKSGDDVYPNFDFSADMYVYADGQHRRIAGGSWILVNLSSWGGCYGDYGNGGTGLKDKNLVASLYLKNIRPKGSPRRDDGIENAINKRLREEEAKKKAEEDTKKKAAEEAKTVAGTSSSSTGNTRSSGRSSSSTGTSGTALGSQPTKSFSSTSAYSGSGGSRVGANGSTTPVYDSLGNTYRITNPATGEVRYFDSEQKQLAYKRQVEAAQSVKRAERDRRAAELKAANIVASNGSPHDTGPKPLPLTPLN